MTVLALAVIASIAAGAPERLPGAARGSEVLRDGVEELRSELAATLDDLRKAHEAHAVAIENLDARLVDIEDGR